MDSDCLKHLLKIWCDNYPCTGEVKGSTLPLNNAVFIVTSNFSIEELYTVKERELNEDGKWVTKDNLKFVDPIS